MTIIKEAISSNKKQIQEQLAARQIDNKYAPYRVQKILDKLHANSTFQELVQLFVTADQMGVEYLVNGYARLLVYSSRVTTIKIINDNIASDIPLHLHVYLKKHVKIRESAALYEYSIADAVEEENGITCFDALYIHDNLFTSSYGLQFLSKKYQFEELEVGHVAFVLNSLEDPDYQEYPLSGINTVKVLRMNILPGNNYQLFERIEQLEQLIVYSTNESILRFIQSYSNIKELTIRGENNLIALPERFFYNFTHLEVLRMSGFGENILVKNLFNGLKNLRELYLNNNKLLTIPKDYFSGLIRLETLDLTSSSVQKISLGGFNGLSHLINLDLSSNELSEIKNAIFSPLHRLEILVIAHTGLEQVSSNCFVGLDSLKSLFLECNFIQADSLESLSKLEYLSLTAIDIGKDPNIFINLEKLKYLRLNVSNLMFGFTGLQKLELLDLGVSNLEVPEEDLFSSLINLKTLNFFPSYIEKLLNRTIFNGLKNLRSLRIESLAVTDFKPGLFSCLLGLQELSLTFGNLRKLKKNSFEGLQNLTSLFLNECNLRYIDIGAFNGLNNLKLLSLSNSYLENLNKNSFYGLTSLEELYLHDCYIVHIKEGAFNDLQNLRNLSLADCNLTIMKSAIFSSLKQLQQLDLSGNIIELSATDMQGFLPHVKKTF